MREQKTYLVVCISKMCQYQSVDIHMSETSRPFINRQKEIEAIFGNLNDNKSVTLVAGEPGIGKSKLLDEVYRMLTYEHQDTVFYQY